MSATAEQCRRYRQNLKRRAYALFVPEGEEPRCGRCKKTAEESGKRLEFVHVKATDLCGSNGRGMTQRYRDVLRHPDCYELVCFECHYARDRRLPMADVRDEPIPW